MAGPVRFIGLLVIVTLAAPGCPLRSRDGDDKSAQTSSSPRATGEEQVEAARALASALAAATDEAARFADLVADKTNSFLIVDRKPERDHVGKAVVADRRDLDGLLRLDEGPHLVVRHANEITSLRH